MACLVGIPGRPALFWKENGGGVVLGEGGGGECVRRVKRGETAHRWDVMYEIIQQNKTQQTKAKKLGT